MTRKIPDVMDVVKTQLRDTTYVPTDKLVSLIRPDMNKILSY